MAGRASLAYSLKYCLGDLIAQKVIGGSDQSIDRVRAASFLTFGGYYGVVNYTVFRLLQTSPWPVAPWSKALFSAVFDGCVHVPLSFYPQFYFFKELVSSKQTKPLSDHFCAGLAKYRHNWFEDCIASAAVFVPIGLLNFRFVPLVWRSPVLAATSVVFPIIVSTQRGASFTTDDSSE
jgi:hypothetical protein